MLLGENNTLITSKYATARFYSMLLILENVITVLSESLSSHVHSFALKYYCNNNKSFELVGVGI